MKGDEKGEYDRLFSKKSNTFSGQMETKIIHIWIWLTHLTLAFKSVSINS